VLRPRVEKRFLPLLTLTAAIAVHDALEGLYSIDCDIKWANDVHVGGKKICGILAETCDTAKGLAVVVGIGVNLKSSNFPPEIAATATSVEAETGRAPDAENFLETLTKCLAEFYAIFQTETGAEKIRAEWTRRSSYAFGKKVNVALENETFRGTTRGIEENGALRVETATGEIRIVAAGDVTNLRAD
jgi:BirA family transcriptional regulator, biotin operon repressor / biotin---[acetyl-CoA-carboxylase] ligase